METTNTKIELNLDADEAERLGRKPRKEDLIPDHLRAKIKPLTVEEREEFGITPYDEAWGKVGAMTVAAVLTVHPDDYSAEQNFKAHRLKLWDKSREELKELLGYENLQNESGFKL